MSLARIHALQGEIQEVYERGVHAPERQLCELASLQEDLPALFDARYSVQGYSGVAFYLLGYQEVTKWDHDGDAEYDTGFVRAVMVGDDREHIVDVDDLIALGEDAYCHTCGQIGCTHDIREDDFVVPGESPDPDWMNP
jgi:hypothetical protein